MIQAIQIKPTAVPTPLINFGSFAAVRGLKGLQMVTSGASISYGGRNLVNFPLAANTPTEVLPVVHLNDLYVVGNGTDVLNVLCFL